MRLKKKADYSERDAEFLKNVALRRITQKEYSEQELILYFVRRGVQKPLAEQVVAELVEKNWLDDKRFSRALVLDGLLKGKAEGYIRLKLKQKGIKLTDPALKALVLDLREERGLDSEEASVTRLIEKRFARKLQTGDRKEFQKAYQWLMRRGYSSQLVLSCLKKASSQLEITEGSEELGEFD